MKQTTNEKKTSVWSSYFRIHNKILWSYQTTIWKRSVLFLAIKIIDIFVNLWCFSEKKNVNFHIQMRECFLLRFIFFVTKKQNFYFFPLNILSSSSDKHQLIDCYYYHYWLLKFNNNFLTNKPNIQKTNIDFDWLTLSSQILFTIYVYIDSVKTEKTNKPKKNDKVERKFVI